MIASVLLALLAAGDLKIESKDPELVLAGRAAIVLVPASKETLTVSIEKAEAELKLTVRSSLQAGVDGQARVKPMRVAAKFRERALESALREGARQAIEDLHARMLEAKGQGARRLTFSIRVNGLDTKAREQVAQVLLPCLVHRLDLVGEVTSAKQTAGFLEQPVEYAPAQDEPRESLRWQAQAAEAAVTGKGVCSILGTPLARFSLAVEPDSLNRAVMVTPRLGTR